MLSVRMRSKYVVLIGQLILNIINQFSGMSWQSSTLQYINTISYNQHKIHKCIDTKKSLLLCKKQILIQEDNQNDLLLIKMQIEAVKDYLKRKYRSTSHLTNMLNIRINHIYLKQTKQICLEIIQQYWEYPTLKQMLKKISNSRSTKSYKTLMMLIQQLFELMLRAGGIDHYFYTSSNIFINYSDQSSNSYMKLIVNPFSINGLKLLFKNSKTISRQALQEIYPCLPANFFSNSSMKQKQVVIKKKCLAYMILCQIIGGEPTILDINKSIRSVNQQEIKKQLTQLPKTYKYLLKVNEKLIEQASNQLNINFNNLFQAILIKDAIDYSWENIYGNLFMSNIVNSSKQTYLNKTTQTNTSHLRIMHHKIWEQQTQKQFYTDRNLQVVHINQQAQISMVYLIVKCNVDFRRLLRHLDLNNFLSQEKYTPEGHQIMNLLMDIYNKNADNSDDSGQQKLKRKIKKKQLKNQPDFNIFQKQPQSGSLGNIVKLGSIAQIDCYKFKKEEIHRTLMILQSRLKYLNCIQSGLW